MFKQAKRSCGNRSKLEQFCLYSKPQAIKNVQHNTVAMNRLLQQTLENCFLFSVII
jgi:hypothetical protein